MTGPAAVRAHIAAALRERNDRAPSDRQLRRWTQEGTIPSVGEESEITPKLLDHVEAAAALLGRGQNRADRVRIVLAVRGFDIHSEILRADAKSALISFGGTVPPMSDDEIVDATERIAEHVIEEWPRARNHPGLKPMRWAINATTIDGAALGETVATKAESLVHNVVSSALGEGMYEPRFLAEAVLSPIDIPESDRSELVDAVAHQLEELFAPGWNDVLNAVETANMTEVLLIARQYRALHAGQTALAIAGGRNAVNHPTNADFMCFVSALYEYIRRQRQSDNVYDRTTEPVCNSGDERPAAR